MNNEIVPHEALKETLPAIHEEPLDNQLSSYLMEVVAARPYPIRFNANSGNIFHELVAHWPDIEGHEDEKRALCARVTEIVYRLTAEMYAEAVNITIATAPPALKPPIALEQMVTYVALDATGHSIRAGYVGPGHPLPEEMQAPIEAGIGVLCQPVQSHHQMTRDAREYSLVGGPAMPLSDPSDRNQDRLVHGVRGELPEDERISAMPQFPTTYPEPPVTAKPPLTSTIATGAAVAAAVALASTAAKAAERPSNIRTGSEPIDPKTGAPNYRPLPYPDYGTNPEYERPLAPDRSALGVPDYRELAGPNYNPPKSPDYRPLPTPDYRSGPEYERTLAPDHGALGVDTRELAGPNYNPPHMEGGGLSNESLKGPDYRPPPTPDYHNSYAPEYNTHLLAPDYRALGPDNRELGGPAVESRVAPGSPEKLNVDAGLDYRAPPTPDYHGSTAAEHDTNLRQPDNRTSGPDQREIAGENYRPVEALNVRAAETVPAREPVIEVQRTEALQQRPAETPQTPEVQQVQREVLVPNEPTTAAPEQRATTIPQQQSVAEIPQAREVRATPQPEQPRTQAEQRPIETTSQQEVHAPEQQPVEAPQQRATETRSASSATSPVTEARTAEAPQQPAAQPQQEARTPEQRPAGAPEQRQPEVSQQRPVEAPQQREVAETRQPEARPQTTEARTPEQRPAQAKQRPAEAPQQREAQATPQTTEARVPEQRPAQPEQRPTEIPSQQQPEARTQQEAREPNQQQSPEARQSRAETPQQRTAEAAPRQEQADARTESQAGAQQQPAEARQESPAQARQQEPVPDQARREEPHPQSGAEPVSRRGETPQQEQARREGTLRDQVQSEEPRQPDQNAAPQNRGQDAAREASRQEPHQEPRQQPAREPQWPEANRRDAADRRETREPNREPDRQSEQRPEQRQTPDRRADRQDEPAAREASRRVDAREGAEIRSPDHNGERAANRSDQRQPDQPSHSQQFHNVPSHNEGGGSRQQAQNEGARGLAEEFRARDERYAREAGTQDRPRSFSQRMGDAVHAGRQFLGFRPQEHPHDYSNLKETSNRLKMKDAMAAKAGATQHAPAAKSATAVMEGVRKPSSAPAGLKQESPKQARSHLMSRLHKIFVHEETPTPGGGGGDEEG